jgi:hypothetical protein
MNDQKQIGVDSQVAELVKRDNGCSSDAIKLAAVALTLIREMFPVQQAESDEAAKLRLELMAEIADTVGEQRFVQAVRRAIAVSHRRWDVSVARIREMAGLRFVPEPSPAAQAWALVTQVFIDHCRSDADGNYHLEEKVVIVDGKAKITPVPEIPLPTKRAIQSLGGWAALAEAWPEYFTQKWNQFREFYSEDSSPRIDSRPKADLERVR